MKVVLIADDSSANQWLLHELETHGLVHHVVRPDWNIARPSEIPSRPRTRVGLVEKMRRRWRAAYFAPIDTDAHRRLARLLTCASPATTPMHVVPAWSINSTETEAYLRDLAPDMLLVSGAPMLRPHIYHVARLGAINLHFGISPTYRGMHTLTVPWWRGDYARVGATVHFIDDGVDTGPALLRVYPTIGVTDDVVTVEATLVRETAQAVCQLLSDFASSGDRPPQGQPLAGEGTLIRFHDRRIRSYLAYRWRRWRGERPRPQSARLERLY